MGKRNSNRKNSALLDSYDDNSGVIPSSNMLPDQVLVSGNEETEFNKDRLLDEAIDALYEKRGSTREKALSSIIDAISQKLEHQFVEKNFATLLDRCLSSIKKGSSKEISLASHVIGLLALMVGHGNNAQEILDESVSPISQALKSGLESSKIAPLVECLAIITFVGGSEPQETEKAMQIMWQLVHPKLGSNVGGVKPSPHIITAVVTAWSFLLSTMEGVTLNPKNWQESISYFSSLLDKDDRSVRIAAGEALAVIFEMGSLEKFSVDISSTQELGKSKELFHVQGLRGKVLNQVKSLSVEASGKGSAKRDLNNQRNLFKDVLEFLEDGCRPETSMKIGGNSLHTSTWSQLIQLNFLRHFLGGGFIKHMHENEFLHDVFGFNPKRRKVGGERPMSNAEKRMFKSPNSAQNKAKTQLLNKQRMLSEARNYGYFAVDVTD